MVLFVYFVAQAVLRLPSVGLAHDTPLGEDSISGRLWAVRESQPAWEVLEAVVSLWATGRGSECHMLSLESHLLHSQSQQLSLAKDISVTRGGQHCLSPQGQA